MLAASVLADLAFMILMIPFIAMITMNQSKCLKFVFSLLGVFVLAGLATMMLMMPLNAVITMKQWRLLLARFPFARSVCNGWFSNDAVIATKRWKYLNSFFLFARCVCVGWFSYHDTYDAIECCDSHETKEVTSGSDGV